MSMETFNYRVLSRDGKLGIYEVYYDGDGKPVTSTTDPLLAFTLPTVDDLRYELETMLRALDEPVLQYDDVNSLPVAAAIKKIGKNEP